MVVWSALVENIDVLIMPTTPYKPARHKADATLPETLFSASTNWVNTCPFNLTGHPAVNVPCGFSAGLPVGMMLVGRRFDEPTLLRFAHAFEEAGHHQ
jgi:amidase